ncbi:hydantoinase B/oxoprolinase family protein [Chloroflexota bacterium]
MVVKKSPQILKEMLDTSQRAYGETGCYAGIMDLEAKESDPLKYELFHSRILSSLISGRETTRMISASPFVREVAELCIGIYTPEGDNIAQSTGIQVHIATMGEVIKWMINNEYETKVGIADGDLFCSNDNSIAGLHPADVYDILPIFWKGELVAWVCTVIMEIDIGSVNPPCMAVPNVERATDGIRICAEKIGSRDEIRHDFEIRIERTIGMYQTFLLDRKGAVAANIRVREDTKNLIEEFGLDYFRQTTRELIEDERRTQLARIKQRMVPGRYRNVTAVELYLKEQPISWLPGKVDTVRLMPVEMTVEPSGTLSIDFDGAGEWGWHSMNATESGVRGGLSIGLVQSMCYDGRANLGSLLPCKLNVPIDTVLNPSRVLELPTANIWTSTIQVFNHWLTCIGSAFYLRGYREEVFGFRTSFGFQASGYNQHGMKGAFLPVAVAGYIGGCAKGVADGVDMGAAYYTPEPDIGNFEVWEMFFPNLDLYRGIDPFSVGHGRFRSGASMNGVWTPHLSPFLMVSSAMGGGAVRLLDNTALFGGYPSGRGCTMTLSQTNIKETVKAGNPLVLDLRNPDHLEFPEYIEGQLTIHDKIVIPAEVHEGDLLITITPSGSGLGDPLDRRSESVLPDLENGFTTEEIVRSIYGIEVKFNEPTEKWEIDEKATTISREDKRKQRLARGVPMRQWWGNARQRIIEKEIDPLLKEMYQSSMKMSANYTQEYRDFWALPDEFVF